MAPSPNPLCMMGVLKEYDQLRKGGIPPREFWDIVVLTTSDEMQHRVYELEIVNKLKRRELPTCARYHVVHDPAGPKIGSGGSTLYTLNELARLEPSWRDLKILMLHAGGQSQRLPNASILGKAFTAIPSGNPLFTMLDVKLAMCMPFAGMFGPGVFICCPDTFETFSFGNNSEIDLKEKSGFVALAHPSPLHIGEGHGVYIIGERKIKESKLDADVLECAKVLQKPTIAAMYEHGAIVDKSHVPSHIREGASQSCEWVFTDSSFFFDHDITEKFLRFYDTHKPLSDELCAYGDFLQGLGYLGDDQHVENSQFIITQTNGVRKMRQNVYNLLKGTPFSTLLLKHSKFYHIGTMQEYLDHFCDSESSLHEEIGFTKFSYSACIGGLPKPEYVDGCVIHSLISPNSSIHSHAVVEYCSFTGPVTVRENSVISNCVYSSPAPLSLPANTFLQTVPIWEQDEDPKYVTLVFSVQDDMKSKAANFDHICDIKYFGKSLDNVCEILHIGPRCLFAEGGPYTLWHARLFPSAETPETSLILAMSMLKKLTSRKRAAENGLSSFNGHNYGSSNGCTEPDCAATNGYRLSGHDNTSGLQKRFSFADLNGCKDAMRMINERNHLARLIQANMQ